MGLLPEERDFGGGDGDALLAVRLLQRVQPVHLVLELPELGLAALEHLLVARALLDLRVELLLELHSKAQ